MRAGLVGRKLGMTQIFTEDGKRVPVTVLEMGPCPVISRRETATDGYNAVQLGFEEVKASRVNKPQRGQFAKANVVPHRILREFRVDEPVSYEVGQTLTVAQFQVGQLVDITGKSVGKGFAGVMKRHGYGGGRASHGAHKVHRSGGSIGQCQSPGRVFKNKKMAGHMGDDTISVQNLKVAVIDVENNLLVVKGSVPGTHGGLVVVRDAVKKS